MATKKHINPTYTNRTAVAPYNFVPLPEKVLPAPKSVDLDDYSGYSGYFDCTLETSSPTYVRGLMTTSQYRAFGEKGPADLTRQEKEERAPFYQIDNRAVIPGSSLRGPFRTLMEIASYSKPLAVSRHRMLYRSVDTTSHGIKYRNRLMEEVSKNQFHPRFKAGYMRQEQRTGDWYIQPAREIHGVSYARIWIDTLDKLWHSLPLPAGKGWTQVRDIYVRVDAPVYQSVRGFLSIYYSKVLEASPSHKLGYEKAVVSRSGRMNSKRSEAVIFPPDPAKNSKEHWLPVSDDLVAVYRDGFSQELRKHFDNDLGVLQDGYPVFYLVEDGQVAGFSHCQMIRLPYKKTPADMVPQEIAISDAPDLTEAIFGYVGKSYSKGEARAGRVFFSDAVCMDKGEVFLPLATPAILGGPKPTSFQLYLEQSNPDNKEMLLDYDSEASIRGTKFYWHKGDQMLQSASVKNDKQTTLIQPVKSGVKFRFKIHFENLDEVELGALAWVLQLTAGDAYRMKIGMGKPLGMGAVRLTSTLRLCDRKKRYSHGFAMADDGSAAWEEAFQSENDPSVQVTKNRCVEYFEHWVLSERVINPDNCKCLIDLPRIQMLLKVLSWPGPQPAHELTRYLEIQRPIQGSMKKKNEYRDRPVLPDPLGVGKKGNSAPKAHKNSIPQEPAPNPIQPRRIVKPVIEVPEDTGIVLEEAESLFKELEKLQAKKPLQRGDIIKATVLEDDGSMVYLEIEGQSDDVLGRILSTARRVSTYSEGEEYRLRVVAGPVKEGGDTYFNLEHVS